MNMCMMYFFPLKKINREWNWCLINTNNIFNVKEYLFIIKKNKILTTKYTFYGSIHPFQFHFSSSVDTGLTYI